MNQLNNIIFDFDGTIADNFPATIKTVKELFRNYNYPEITPADVKIFRQQGARAALKKFKVPFWQLPKLLRQGQEINRPKLLGSPLIDGIDLVLKKVREESDFLAILSTNSAETITQYLSQHDLLLFDHILESGLFNKASHLNKIVEKFSLNRNSTVYVGDEPRDFEAAHKAGIKSVAVTWGYSDADRLKQERPTWLVDRPEELLQILT